MQLTRRTLATVLASAAGLAAHPPQTTPAPAEDDDLKTARDRLQANARLLAATPVPMATEPAFQFKA
jgi:hypothetical protein